MAYISKSQFTRKLFIVFCVMCVLAVILLIFIRFCYCKYVKKELCTNERSGYATRQHGLIPDESSLNCGALIDKEESNASFYGNDVKMSMISSSEENVMDDFVETITDEWSFYSADQAVEDENEGLSSNEQQGCTHSRYYAQEDSEIGQEFFSAVDSSVYHSAVEELSECEETFSQKIRTRSR
ncbi:hypothetical protein VCUG_00273 [Vavraia culicis subsp. floridensis]|uniref:Uncharacterized protein n=1 Tax=Vavraia culicis (isolate floridensis) TaxID=948595 RepID=L2GXZ3_VAVCU|nr:uncharacterized protein VCUG_00273 [Vavraia culicis subsp. floridensis]ELA48232.1 hypothetical protein VCUG_00273 [Vavraia culicis subsp. floridensis]